ncbi:ATP-binding cassette domain-containing protein [Streptomyces prunicolor]|uniref:ATP-binding cassette domain-containing protein n=1 Tax=Streptomyces prunicolor TaxID=67348 RepID=A0ABU4FBS7_9ACTN|nr:ATP-binding cassette domain-containing protein [Streptomyces prunicolor]MDV7218049.1 ATP-binding cassette domain-containing protein [Streptomyces prunicolor]
MSESTPAAPVRTAIADRGIAKTFGHVKALVDANVTVAAGEVVALFGDNGAGKSTFLKCLQGIHRPDQGEITMDDQPVELHSIRDAQSHGVECVHQDLALAPDLSVIDNMFLGHESLRRGLLGRVGTLARAEIRSAARRAPAR